jgi:hypothetical protein
MPELRGFTPIGMLEYSISGTNSEAQKIPIFSEGCKNSGMLNLGGLIP